MDNQLVGQSQTCWECFKDCGQHTLDCSIGKELRKHQCERDGHEWQASGLILMKWNNHETGLRLDSGPEVDVCQHCGLLRIPDSR
jgi:hypothetical protein